MRQASKRGWPWALPLLLAGGALGSAGAEGPPPESELLTRARATVADVEAFEHLNQDIVTLCHEPVKGSYADFRDDFHDDLARVRELERALGPTAAELAAAAARATEPSVQPFRAAGDQELYARCLRWGTALIQRESRLRADIAAKFTFLKSNEAAIRAALATKP